MNTSLLISTALYITLISIILYKKSSKNTKVIVILFNCVIVSLLFFHIFQYKFVNVEGLVDKPKSDESVEKLLTPLKMQAIDIMNNTDDIDIKEKKILKIINDAVLELPPNKREGFKKSIKSEFENSVEYKKREESMDKIESGLNNAPTENIITLDQLSNENKKTLQQIYTKMSTTDIENMFKLDNDKFTQMLNEITMTKK
jgi:hypothetical protein